MSQWLDRHYRALMLWAMLVELILLGAITWAELARR